jgi:hypothetical protein
MGRVRQLGMGVRWHGVLGNGNGGEWGVVRQGGLGNGEWWGGRQHRQRHERALHPCFG